MKIFKSSLFILFTLLFSVSCSKDDGGNNVVPPAEELTVIIEGVEKTFNSIVLSTNTYANSGNPVDYKAVTATIDGNTSEIIYFELGDTSTGANVIWTFEYTINGDVYSDDNSEGITSVVSVNNETTVSATFSGFVEKWNNTTMSHDSVSFLNGAVTANQ